jgi:hypothetical protein
MAMRTRLYLALTVVVATCVSLAAAPVGADVDGKVPAEKELRAKCLTVLRDGLRDGSDFVKIHAAEALLKNGYPEGVKKTFVPDAISAPPKYRIGVWRVLAQAYSRDTENRGKCVAWIVQAFKDKDGPDRLHASETLGKLGYSDRSSGALSLAKGPESPLQVNALWILANSGNARNETDLAAGLKSHDIAIRTNTAYALRFLPRLRSNTISALKLAIKTESDDSDARVYLLSALYVHGAKQERAALRDSLLRYVTSGRNDQHIEACAALAQVGADEDLQPVLRLLTDKELDVRIAAANAILGIASR